MSDHIISAIVTIVTAIIGVAVLATFVSGRAQTSQIIGTSAQGLASDLAAAEAPVTGGSSFGSGFSGFTGGAGEIQPLM